MACFVPKKAQFPRNQQRPAGRILLEMGFPIRKNRNSAAHAAKFDFILPAFWQTEARKGFGPLALCNEF